MRPPDLILTLAVALTAALGFGYVTQRLSLSPLVGYLLAGLVLGPYTPGFVANQEFAQQLAELGVLLLMFGVGLQFHVDELLRVRRVAVPGAIAGIVSATLLAGLAAKATGWSWPSALVFGLTLSIASTVVLVRVLSDSDRLHTSSGHIAIGWLVVEDVLAVLLLVLLPTMTGRNLTVGGVLASVALTLAKVAGLVALAAVGGHRVIPRILDAVAVTRSRELFTLTVFTLAIGIAVASTAVFGVSMPLGAFVAGMVVGRSEYSLRAATDALPMRDAFAVLFFVSVGMLLDPTTLLDTPGLLVAALGVVVLGKPIVAGLVIALLNYPLRTVLAVPAALAQIGEFSFLLATLARDLDVIPPAALNIVVAVSILSILINPLVSRLIGPLERWITRRAGLVPLPRHVDVAQEEGRASSIEPGDRAVVVGYGPTGRTVARLLRDNGISPTIIELNIESVRELRDAGLSAVYGDARAPDTLVRAGIRHADTLIVSGADEGAGAAIQAARALNARVHVFVRAAHLRDVKPLRTAGAEQVFSGEGEVALAMTEAVLRRLGATPDQIDRERERVRDELSS